MLPVAPLEFDPDLVRSSELRPSGQTVFYSPFAASPGQRRPPADPYSDSVRSLVIGGDAWSKSVGGSFHRRAVPGRSLAGRPLVLPRAFMACTFPYPTTDPDGLVPFDPGSGAPGYGSLNLFAPLPLAGVTVTAREMVNPNGTTSLVDTLGYTLADLAGSRGGDLYVLLEFFALRTTDLYYPYFLNQQKRYISDVRRVYGPRCRKLRLAAPDNTTTADDGGVYPRPAELGLDKGIVANAGFYLAAPQLLDDVTNFFGSG